MANKSGKATKGDASTPSIPTSTGAPPAIPTSTPIVPMPTTGSVSVPSAPAKIAPKPDAGIETALASTIVGKLSERKTADTYSTKVVQIFGANFPENNYEMFACILFTLKSLQITATPTSDFTTKFDTWHGDKSLYKDSAISKNLRLSLEKIKNYLQTVDATGKNGVLMKLPKEEVISAASFVKAYEPQIVQMSEVIKSIIPKVPKAAYQRALYMTMNFSNAYAVLYQRLNIALEVCDRLRNLGIDINPNQVADSASKKTASDAWGAKFNDILTKIPYVEPEVGWTTTMLGVHKPEDLPFDVLLEGAYPSNFPMMLQSKSIRNAAVEKFDMSAVGPAIRAFLSLLFGFFNEDGSLTVGINVMDKENPVVQRSWVLIKTLKYACKVWRTARKQGKWATGPRVARGRRDLVITI